MAAKIIGVGRSGQNLKAALEIGILDSVATPEEAAAEADLVIICTPVLSILPTLEKIAPHLKEGALVTDAGSTKKEIVEKGERIAGKKFFFIGSHPIAGTEKSGARASFETLFENKKCVVTPTASTSPEKLTLVENLWRSAGMEMVTMSPSEHDAVFAAISHLPHMAAFALVNVVCDLPDGEKLLGFAGGGFRDTTRIASSPPEMWADVALANSDSLVDLVEKMKGQLGEIESAIKARDRQKLLTLFEKANRYREKLR